MEGLACVFKGCVAVPLQNPCNIGSMGLLFNALDNVLLCVADLGPTVVVLDLGRGVGVDLRQRRT